MARKRHAHLGFDFEGPVKPGAPALDAAVDRTTLGWEANQQIARMLAPWCNHQWEQTVTIWPGETVERLTRTCRGRCGLVMGRC